MTDLAWIEQRNAMRESRDRCLATLADVWGCSVDELPLDVRRAVVLHGHECYQVAHAAAHEDAHDRATLPAPPRAGEYREPPTRVDRLRQRSRAR